MACRIKSTPDTVHSRQSINVETVTRCGMWTQIADACGYCVQRLPTPGHLGLCFCPKGGQRVHPGIPSRSCPASMLATAPDLPLRGGLTHAACLPVCLSVYLPTICLTCLHRATVGTWTMPWSTSPLHTCTVVSSPRPYPRGVLGPLAQCLPCSPSPGGGSSLVSEPPPFTAFVMLF